MATATTTKISISKGNRKMGEIKSVSLPLLSPVRKTALVLKNATLLKCAVSTKT